VNPGDPLLWVPDAVVTIDKVSLGEGQWFGTPSQNSVKDAKFATGVLTRVCRVSAVWTSDGLVSLPVFVNGGQLSGFFKTKPVVLATVKPLLEAGVPACVFGRLAASEANKLSL
jgi:putative intracellular protease/amidase